MGRNEGLKDISKPSMVAHTFNSSTQEAKAGGFLWVHGQPGLHGEFQMSQGYTQNPVSKNQVNKINMKNKHISEAKLTIFNQLVCVRDGKDGWG